MEGLSIAGAVVAVAYAAWLVSALLGLVDDEQRRWLAQARGRRGHPRRGSGLRRVGRRRLALA